LANAPNSPEWGDTTKIGMFSDIQKLLFKITTTILLKVQSQHWMKIMKSN
jgi:hypothetical protein